MEKRAPGRLDQRAIPRMSGLSRSPSRIQVPDSPRWLQSTSTHKNRALPSGFEMETWTRR